MSHLVPQAMLVRAGWRHARRLPSACKRSVVYTIVKRCESPRLCGVPVSLMYLAGPQAALLGYLSSYSVNKAVNSGTAVLLPRASLFLLEQLLMATTNSAMDLTNMGRGAYDTTGRPNPQPKPKPK
ncbi:uncharacterized protein B0I36DRAFT_350102 [Microdochium trichocladiopsis]|uniref:Uncharacterized protein n=1 Tax=Microdochium trichocladiopsis TaxID=1682393 RepID=A0A9P8Y4G6_9PEZI|nr:uncharacterized protein B0I36DRAFT_350102 [Microdochium trichocladiopsis]KAH7029180.1 hypothetical protein B0I36DRAFT_350102 [Microdochium trichocladiopsis]